MAFYTRLKHFELHRLLAEYGLECAVARPLAGGQQNTSYLLDCGERELVLTVLDDHDELSAATLVRVLRYAGAHGVTVGQVVETAAGHGLARLGTRCVLLREYLGGNCFDWLPTGRLRQAGQVLGRIHGISAPEWLPVRRRRLESDAQLRVRSFADRQFAAWLVRRLDEAEPALSLDGPTGLLHGDYFSDNLVVTMADQVAVLDWETATVDLLVLDLGMAVVGLCGREGEFVPERLAPLLAGYSKVRAPEPAELAVLREATVHAAAVIAYHRYLRHHVTHPDPAQQHLYREMPAFIDSVDRRWPEAAVR